MTAEDKRVRVLWVHSFIDKPINPSLFVQLHDRSRYNIHFVFLNPGDSHIEDLARNAGLSTMRIVYRGKRDLLSAWWQLFWLMLRWRPQVVHAQLFDAGMAAIPMAWLTRVRRRLYTRHYATLHLDFYPNGVKWDKLLNTLSTHILSISPNVTHTLTTREGVAPQKIILTPHGFDLTGYANANPEQVAALKQNLKLVNKGPIVGVVARFTWLKGIQHIIPAFAALLQDYPNAHLLLFNAVGDDADKIHALLQQHCPNNHTCVVEQADARVLFHLFDVYVHVPIDPSCEAFGQTYIEALAAGVPSIFTLSGIASEFVQHEHNAWVVPYQDSDAIYQGMLRLLQDDALRQRLIVNGRASVANFTIAQMVARTQAAYFD